MLIRSALACLVFVLASISAAQAQVTYNYTSPVYNAVSPHIAPDCSAVGGCADYNISQSVTGTITLTAPLTPNLVSSLIPATSVVSYSFSDGINTIASSEAAARLYGFQVTTDASGVITSAIIEVQEWRDGLAAGHAAGAFAGDTSTNVRLNSIWVGSTSFGVRNNRICGAVIVSLAGVPDTCNAPPVTDQFTSVATIASNGTWTLVVVPTIPTLSEWALILLALLFAGGGALIIHRRSRTA